jgi:hypothetical protein
VAYRTPETGTGSGVRPLPDGADSYARSAVFDAASGDPVTLPGGQFVSDATYLQQGDDLLLIGPDGTTVTIENYFAQTPRPDLLVPGGGRLTPALVDSFTPPEAAGQYAQAGTQLAQTGQPIGQVQDISGQVFAVRADGTRVQLSAGDQLFQGDVVETAAGGAVNLIFVDETTFALGSDARLALDELVYNPATQQGTSSFSMLKGVFVFVSGQIAKTDNTQMTVTTPVATIGIRGTTVAGDVKPAGEESRFTVIDGEIAVTTQGGTVIMSEANATTIITNFLAAPTIPVVYSPTQINANYGSISNVNRSILNKPGTNNNTGGNPEDLEPQAGGEEGGDGEGGDGGSSGNGGDAEIPDQQDVTGGFGEPEDPLPDASPDPI